MAAVAAAAATAFKFVAGAFAATAAGTATVLQIGTVIGVNLLSSVAIGALSTALSPQSKAGRAPGATNDWKADPSAPVLNIWGRFGTGGYIVFQKAHGAGDKFLSTVSVLSLGPVQEIEKQWFGDEVLTATNPARANGNVTGTYAGAIWTHWQLGATPESLALPVLPATATISEWTSAHKISGMAAAFSTFDVSQTAKLTRGIQKARWDVKGHLCYDPRKDSTYPGGSGSHRIGTPSTWEWSDNPWLCALKYTLGIKHNGVLRDGINADPSLIVMSDFVAGANWSDDQNWGCGGISTTADPKGQVLAALLEAGGGVRVRKGGKLGAMVDAPSVSVGALGVNDFIGPISITRSKPFDQVFNTAIPRFSSEDHGFEQMAGSPYEIGGFATADGQTITQEVALSMVIDTDQAAQLAAYRAWASRIKLVVAGECKSHVWRYEVGDCVTLTLPASGIVGVKMRIVKTVLNPVTFSVQVVMQEELDARHADAAAANTTLPPVVDLSISGDIQQPIPEEWATTATHTGSVADIETSGILSNISNLTAIAVYYRRSVDPDWILHVSGPPASPFFAFIPDLSRSTNYDIGVEYIRGTILSGIVQVGDVLTP